MNSRLWQQFRNDPRLLGYWPFKGDTNDYSGNGHHATLTNPNNCIWPASFPYFPGGGYYFTGSQNNFPQCYIRAAYANLSNKNEFTAMAWCALATADQTGTYTHDVMTTRGQYVAHGPWWSMGDYFNADNGTALYPVFHKKYPLEIMRAFQKTPVFLAATRHFDSSVSHYITRFFVNGMLGGIMDVTGSGYDNNSYGITWGLNIIGYSNVTRWRGWIGESMFLSRAVHPFEVKEYWDSLKPKLYVMMSAPAPATPGIWGRGVGDGLIA